MITVTCHICEQECEARVTYDQGVSPSMSYPGDPPTTDVEWDTQCACPYWTEATKEQEREVQAMWEKAAESWHERQTWAKGDEW